MKKTYRELLIDAVDKVCATVPISPFSTNTEDGISKLKAIISATIDGDEWLTLVFSQVPIEYDALFVAPADDERPS